MGYATGRAGNKNKKLDYDGRNDHVMCYVS